MGLEEGFALLFLATVFFLETVFVFNGFLADVLRTDFFEAINDPFYVNERVIVLSSMGQNENDNVSQVSQQGRLNFGRSMVS